MKGLRVGSAIRYDGVWNKQHQHGKP
ncbi:hypothetical protein HNR46_004269, partial [Haloferula luteola]|nr:hypothetical protein [Haloferula luteola]MBB5353997.1 hypothetical protein [Haloferula luteola]